MKSEEVKCTAEVNRNERGFNEVPHDVKVTMSYGLPAVRLSGVIYSVRVNGRSHIGCLVLCLPLKEAKADPLFAPIYHSRMYTNLF